MSSVAANKQTVLAFLRTAWVEGDIDTAVKAHLGDEYRQHNPGAEDGPDAFRVFANQVRRDHPEINVEPIRVIAEDDLVAVHMRVTGMGPELAIVDIFRVDDAGRIVEHWDVTQEVPATSANANGMF
jgi:predicted SnoaL-like aldol condensation-catalyzing enzyme